MSLLEQEIYIDLNKEIKRMSIQDPPQNIIENTANTIKLFRENPSQDTDIGTRWIMRDALKTIFGEKYDAKRPKRNKTIHEKLKIGTLTTITEEEKGRYNLNNSSVGEMETIVGENSSSHGYTIPVVDEDETKYKKGIEKIKTQLTDENLKEAIALFYQADNRTDPEEQNNELEAVGVDNEMTDLDTKWTAAKQDYEGHADAQLAIGICKFYLLLNIYDKKKGMFKGMFKKNVTYNEMLNSEKGLEVQKWIRMAIKNGANWKITQVAGIFITTNLIKQPTKMREKVNGDWRTPVDEGGGGIRKRRSSRKKIVKKSGRKTVNTNKKSKKQTRRTRKHKRRGTVS